MTTALALLLQVAAPLPQPAAEPDISCEQFGHYTGNAISPTFQLKIGGPQKREWTYSSSDDMFGMRKPPREATYRGTYEIDGDLAVFTGEQVEDRTRPLRFGLNYGFPGGKVAFDRFFPTAAGEFSYHRKWFRQKDGKWQPAEERKLTLTLPEKLAGTIEVKYTGQRVRWDADGKRAEEPIDGRLRYKASGGWYVLETPPAGKKQWLPGDLILESVKDKIVAITWGNRYIGDLRGFNPGAAELPGGP